VITVTGTRDVVTAADEPLLKSGAVLANAGALPLRARCAGAVGPEACVVPVPRAIDETVAAAFVLTA
jgi:hypothetical protein